MMKVPPHVIDISQLCNEVKLERKSLAYIKMLSLICQFNLKAISQGA